jgi:glycolate oxidase FAD binding subunit
MMVGSLGTLGLVATVTFRLHPLPESDVTLVARARTARGVRELASAMRGAQLEPAAVAALLQGQRFDVAIRFEGFPAGVAEQRDRLRQLVGQPPGSDCDVLSEAEARAVWELHDALRTAGPLRAKLAFLPAALDALAEGPLAKLMDALGEPSFVLYPTLGLGFVAGLPKDAALVAQAVESVRGSLAGTGGSLVLEEAPDDVRVHADPWGPPPASFALMRELKDRLDPEGRLNPGRFVGGI